MGLYVPSVLKIYLSDIAMTCKNIFTELLSIDRTKNRKNKTFIEIIPMSYLHVLCCQRVHSECMEFY